MKGKLGSFDGAVRSVLGLLVLLIGHHVRSWWGLVGLMPLLTAVIGFCPVYWFLRIDTRTPEEIDPADDTHHGKPVAHG